MKQVEAIVLFEKLSVSPPPDGALKPEQGLRKLPDTNKKTVIYPVTKIPIHKKSPLLFSGNKLKSIIKGKLVKNRREIENNWRKSLKA